MMPRKYEDFASEVIRVMRESEAVRKADDLLGTQITQAEKDLQDLKKRRRDSEVHLKRLEEEEQELMNGRFMHPTATATPEKTKARLGEQHKESPITPSNGLQSRRDSVCGVSSSTSAKETAEPKDLFTPNHDDNDTITVVPNSTPSSKAPTNAPKPRSKIQDTLVTKFVDPPKDFWYQCRLHNKAIHPSFPNIISMDGHWTEISCSFCGANSFQDAKGIHFFGGIIGLYNHKKRWHGDVISKAIVDTTRSCTRRIVSVSDAEFLKVGQQPLHEINHRVGGAGDSYDGESPPTGSQTPANVPSTPAPTARMQPSDSPQSVPQPAIKRAATDDSPLGTANSVSRAAPTSAKKRRLFSGEITRQ